MTSKVRCYQPKSRALCARAHRTKSERATHCAISTTALKEMGLSSVLEHHEKLEATIQILLTSLSIL